MKIQLTKKDANMLAKHKIAYAENKDYSEDEAFALLDDVHDAEIFFAQSNSAQDGKSSEIYAKIADIIQAQI